MIYGDADYNSKHPFPHLVPHRTKIRSPNLTTKTLQTRQLARRRSRLRIPPYGHTGLRQHQHLRLPRPRPSQTNRLLRLCPRLRRRPRSPLLPAPDRPHHLRSRHQWLRHRDGTEKSRPGLCDRGGGGEYVSGGELDGQIQ